jgi:hypothetical protein
MNRSLSNGRYSDKRTKFKEKSMFTTARLFAEKYSEWTPELLEKRSDDLAKWAISRWVY